MNDFKKIEYYDLRAEALDGKLPQITGRTEEMERITRVVGRRINNNILIVGPSGIGKTTLTYGWFSKASRNEQFSSLQLVQLDDEHIHYFDDIGEQGTYYRQALETLPPSVLFIDNFGRAVNNSFSLANRVSRFYNPLLKNTDMRVILTLQPHEYSWLEREYPGFIQSFEVLSLKSQASFEYVRILQNSLARLNKQHRIFVPETSFREIVSYAEHFPVLGQLPRSAISLLDESLASAAAEKRKDLTDDIIAEVVAGKTGIPKIQLKPDELETLKNIEKVLGERIINQDQAIAKIARTLQRAKLGIRNPNKPLGSFLILGPSGVGKTETAKSVAEMMFSRSESFVRFDMSEFSQDHTVQRLIGAPAGYVGYEGGGAITNALRKEPHCLILLDEIEKAHPKIFDIFLQVLDDGRLTSGQNETVDARNAIIMATSNIGVEEILKGFEAGADIHNDEFIKEKIMPLLEENFRLEFLNRFDGILIFNPLTLPGLVKIAKLEIKKIEQRLSKHRVQFELEESVLEERIKNFTDPRFGARPVKRFIEETCETLLMRTLLNK